MESCTAQVKVAIMLSRCGVLFIGLRSFYIEYMQIHQIYQTDTNIAIYVQKACIYRQMESCTAQVKVAIMLSRRGVRFIGLRCFHIEYIHIHQIYQTDTYTDIYVQKKCIYRQMESCTAQVKVAIMLSRCGVLFIGLRCFYIEYMHIHHIYQTDTHIAIYVQKACIYRQVESCTAQVKVAIMLSRCGVLFIGLRCLYIEYMHIHQIYQTDTYIAIYVQKACIDKWSRAPHR